MREVAATLTPPIVVTLCVGLILQSVFLVMAVLVALLVAVVVVHSLSR